MINGVFFILAVISISLNAMAQIALRKTMLALGALPTALNETFSFAASVLSNVWFYVGMGCYALSIGVWLVVLSRLEVSVAYPLQSIGYVIAATIGFFFLNENLTLLRTSGIGLICLGVILISRSA